MINLSLLIRSGFFPRTVEDFNYPFRYRFNCSLDHRNTPQRYSMGYILAGYFFTAINSCYDTLASCTPPLRGFLYFSWAWALSLL